MINEQKVDNYETFDILLTVKSPVHIGCDECYEPHSYKILNDKIVIFNELDFFKNLAKEERYKISADALNAIDDVKYKEICDYIQKINGNNLEGKEIVVSSDFKKEYENAKTFKQFDIARTAYLKNDGRPYIPGSSIKGSLRTAYLNLISKKKNLKLDGIISSNSNENNKIAKRFESKLLNANIDETKTDPFRLVKISDFLPIGDVKTKIVYAKNFKKKNGNGRNLTFKSRLEVIPAGSQFCGKISILQPLDNKEYIKEAVTVPNLQASIKEFYVNKYKIDINRPYYFLGKGYTINKRIDNFEGKYLLQVGRYSGADAVTIENRRQINIKQIHKTLSSTTTIWLANESDDVKTGDKLEFFSWVEIEKCDEKKLKEFTTINNNYLQCVINDKFAKKQSELEKSKQKQLEQEMLKAKEEELRKQKEEQERFNALLKEEQVLIKLQNKDLLDNEVGEFFKFFKELADTNIYKIKLANAFKEHYIANNKWDNQKKKQGDKVQYIKQVLGE